MSIRRAYKWLIGIAFVIAALVIFCANALFIWVATGPRSLNALTPYLEEALAPPGSHHHVKVESSELIWEGWHHPVGIHVKNAKVTNDAGATVAVFPEIGVRLYFFKLLLGHPDLKTVEVLGPTVVLTQAEDGSLSFGFGGAGETPDHSLGAALGLFASAESPEPVSHLQSLIIRHANLSIVRGHSGVFLQSPDAALEINRRHGKIKGTLTMPLTFEDKKSELTAEFGLSAKDKTIRAEVVYTDIPSAILYALFPTQQWMSAAHMPVSGWANIASDFDLHISSIDFLVEAGPGSVDYPSELEKPLALQRVRVEGSLTDGLNTITVKQGLLNFKTFNISLNGTVHKQADDYALDGAAEIGSLPGDDVRYYWPKTLAPQTRHWVITHIGKGIMEKATMAAHFGPGEMKLKETPEHAVDATINVKNVSIRYLAKHPPVNDVTGSIHFTGKSMEAKVSSASYLSQTHASSGSVTIPDLNAPEVRMFIEVAPETTAKDVREFLALPGLEKTRMLQLTPDISGQASGVAKLDFVAFSDQDNGDDPSKLGEVHYSVSADLKNVSQKAFMGDRDIANANVKLDLDNKGLKVSGTAGINEVPMHIDLATRFGKGPETSYTVKTQDMPLTQLARFGLPTPEWAKGTMGVDASFLSSDAGETAKATLDLTNVAVDFPEQGFTKKPGEKATLTLSTEQKEAEHTSITSFALRGDDFSASGKAEYEKMIGDISSASFDTLHFGNDELSSLEYVRGEGTLRIDAKGHSLDVSSFFKKKPKEKSSRSYDVNIEVDRLILGEKRELRNASVKADCGEHCHAASIKATLPDGTPFTYTIGNGKLEASCNNAGELLRVLNIFDGISGGKLMLTGDYKNDILAGKLLMTNYTLKRAPVLTRIFTVASLTGILDTLSGNGIAFEKLSAAFLYQGDTLTIKDAKAYGPALGITTDGSVNDTADSIDVQGTLVPSYTLNSLVGNVPLIGTILTGGQGKGIFALNYTVKGKISDPSVMVNPLSALTPGFLRNVFNIFDKPAPDFDKIRAQAQEQQDKAASQQPQAATPESTDASQRKPVNNGTP